MLLLFLFTELCSFCVSEGLCIYSKCSHFENKITVKCVFWEMEQPLRLSSFFFHVFHADIDLALNAKMKKKKHFILKYHKLNVIFKLGNLSQQAKFIFGKCIHTFHASFFDQTVRT